MKSKSIKSIAAVLASAVLMSGTVFAGPGPNDPPKSFRRGAETVVVVKKTNSAAKAQRSDNKAVAGSKPRLQFDSGARGNRIVLR